MNNSHQELRCPHISNSQLRSLSIRNLPENLAGILEQYSRETDEIDFKESLDLRATGGWCEIIKDIVAMANSGGGVVLIGVYDNGTSTGGDVQPLLDVDPATWTDKLTSYTGEPFADIALVSVERQGKKVAAIVIQSAGVPLVFGCDGNYPDPNDPKKQKFAFRRGSVYFRHNAKSEPAVRSDLVRVFDRLLEEHREAWLGNIRRVMEAPADHQVVLVPTTSPVVGSEPAPIRLTNDPNATVFKKLDIDEAYPFRSKELVLAFKARTGQAISSHDVNCVKKVHNIGPGTPNYFHHTKFGSKQYSREFLNWLVEQFQLDKEFFRKASFACKATLK